MNRITKTLAVLAGIVLIQRVCTAKAKTKLSVGGRDIQSFASPKGDMATKIDTRKINGNEEAFRDLINHSDFEKKKTYTITDLDDNLLVDIANDEVISVNSVKVYVNDQLA